MLEDWAGVAIIVTVQFITFFFIKRKFDRLDEAISRLEITLAETRVELAEQMAAFKEYLLGELTASKEDLVGQIAAMDTEPPPFCYATNLKCTAAPKNGQTR